MGWDSKYSKGHNDRRRERYAKDPEYAKQQRERSAANRAKNRDETGRLLKELNGAMVPVYKMAEIAEHCDVSVTRVRNAFQKGRLPESSFEGKHIYVTKEQLKLIKYAFDNPKVNDEDMRVELEGDW